MIDDYEQKIAIFLMGPTAAGKTDLAVQLAEYFPVDIISVDSAQIYRDMNIGTAKPNAEILAKFPHKLIDIRDPPVSYSAAEFRIDALAAMQQICENGRIPLLVGGSGLYFRALRYGLSALPRADPVLRLQLEQEATQRGWAAMHADLASVDPTAAARIHPHDAQRIQRALEVWYLTKKPLSAQQLGSQDSAPPMFYGEHSDSPQPYKILILALAPRSRELLRNRIAKRFYLMLEQGLEQEVQFLLNHWQLTLDKPALRSVGYRQVVSYLQGDGDYMAMVQCGITASQGLAKRQLTWLRSEIGVHWLHDEDGDPIVMACKYLAQRL